MYSAKQVRFQVVVRESPRSEHAIMMQMSGSRGKDAMWHIKDTRHKWRIKDTLRILIK